MIEDSIIRAILSNLLTCVNLSLLIYTFLLKEKNRLLATSNASLIIMIMVYLVSGCYTSAFANLFSMGRNIYCEKCKKKNKAIILAIILLGTLLTFIINYKSNGLEKMTIIPVISFLVYSVGIFVTKTANQMKFVSALDVLLWITYDFKNMLIVCVFQDVFIVLITCASYYVKFVEQKAENKTEVSYLNN